MTIRIEKEDDYKKIYDMLKLTFTLADHSDGKEQDLVNNLRNGKSYINNLTLVCEEKDEIVGFIMFSEIQLGNFKSLALAPLAVLPKFQHMRLGTLLIKEGLKRAKNLGYYYVLVLGDDKYYSKFGFVPAKEFGITSPFKVPNKNFMALNLHHNKNKLNCTAEYPKEFFN